MMLNILAVESLCANSCFIILFLTTIYYWSKIIFAPEITYTQTGLFGYSSAVFLITTQLILRWVDSGHFPLSNLYESLLFLAWCLLILYIYIETSIKTLFLGVLTSPTVLCLVSFTDFLLPPELQQSHPLVPALQSNWLVMHVTVMIASYAALLLGCLVSIAYVIFSHYFGYQNKLSQQGFVLENNLSLLDSNSSAKPLVAETNANLNAENNLSNFLQIPKLKNDNQNGFLFLNFLDNLSYRTIGIGFCFLTLGILSGAVWANETWGNYWSWDPKETWALITWLTFASYLHSRLIGNWAGYKPACIASFGFVIIWVCYLGVNILGQGLHSYGFLQL